MKRTLRKGNHGVYVSYRPFGNTDSLIACDFTLEADEQRILLSMDFSVGERTRYKSGNLYTDTRKLTENISEVESLQLEIEKWVHPLATALKAHRTASKELEMRFKDSPSRIYRYDLEADHLNLWFKILHNEQAA